MNKHTARLLEKHFDTAFAAPDGIKKLRELILTLAMQGKLVPQDPNDQPASELLKEIEAEKLRLVQEGKIKNPKPLPPVTDEEKPYALPQGWEWVRLGEIGIWKSGSTPSRSNSAFYGGNISWVKSGEVKQGHIRHTEETITPAALDKCSLHINDIGSVLVAMYGANIGEVGILKIEAATNQAVCACKTYTSFDENYLLYLITSLKPYFLSQGAGAAQPNISREKIIATVFPLPPAVEQSRIVYKIDELMARCDELEKLRTAQQEKRLTVHVAAIKQLLNIAEPDQHQRAQAFLAKHFGELYTAKENVTELRKAILQLAVMGKLVPQNPNDQPASELLKEIEAEKQRLVKEGKLKKLKPLPPVTEKEKPYALPQGWEWARLGDLISYMDAGWSPKCEVEPAKNNEWGVLKTTAVQALRFLAYENKSLPKDLSPRPDTQVEKNDVLITRAGPKNRVGICCVANPVPPKLMLSDKIIRFKIYGDLISPGYCALVLNVGYSASQIEKFKSGMADSQMNISQDKVRQIIIAAPPIAEQNRIITKIDEMMNLCDSLEQKIDTIASKQAELLNAVMHTQSQGNTAEEPQQTPSSKAQIIDLATYRSAIGCYAVSKLADAQYFGRTAAAKVLYLAQAHIGLDLNFQPEREAAGPLDKWIYDFEQHGQCNGWFEVNEKTLKNGHQKAEYRCLPDLSAPLAQATATMLPEQQTEFDRLIYALADKTTEEVEIIATLFAVWNDFLIDGVTPTDEQIITDMRENWHERKARFSPADLKKWLAWLRSEQFVPRGLPPRTVQQSRLKLV